MKKIIIIGAGAMGSAFAVPCLDNKNKVTVVGSHLEDNLIEIINSNNRKHPALKTQLPKEIKFERFEKLQTILKELDKTHLIQMRLNIILNKFRLVWLRYKVQII